MWLELLVRNFTEVVARASAHGSARDARVASAAERGLPLILAQLAEALHGATGAAPVEDGGSAARHACALLEQGWACSRVVQEYGDLRRAITQLASAEGTVVGPDELDALERCLESASADAVEAYARLKDAATAHREDERLGQVGHDLRNQLQTAQLAFSALRTGRTAIGGAAGDALGRSLARIGEIVDERLSGGDLAATSRVSVSALVHEVAVAAHLDAERRELRLAILPGDPALAVDVDPKLLASALMNLLRNAVQHTRPHGCVTLRTRSEDDRAIVEVEDECGGLDQGGLDRCEGEAQRAAGERRCRARAASGHGLADSRRAVQANGGEVQSRNLPGKGCVFGIRLALAAPLHTPSRVTIPLRPSKGEALPERFCVDLPTTR